MIVGRIAQIWRHPVKSMQGERLEAAHVGKQGIPAIAAGRCATKCGAASAARRRFPR